MSSELDGLRAGLEEELAVAIATARGGEAAGSMARAVLEHDRRSRVLLGVTEGARQAVYYDGVSWSIVFIPFDAEGLATRDRRLVEKRRHRNRVEAWVQENAGGFTWLHPRVRWTVDCLELEEAAGT